MTSKNSKSKKTYNIISRLLYLAVFISNMICIVSFVINPSDYIDSYQLNGSAGAEAAVIGMGIAFAMWNVTYPFYIFSRKNDKKLGLIIIVQQIVGLLGETYIKLGLGNEHTVLISSIDRFIIFDAGGLILLIIGFILINKIKN